jgi:hypothetical protein
VTQARYSDGDPVNSPSLNPLMFELLPIFIVVCFWQGDVSLGEEVLFVVAKGATSCVYYTQWVILLNLLFDIMGISLRRLKLEERKFMAIQNVFCIFFTFSIIIFAYIINNIGENNNVF